MNVTNDFIDFKEGLLEKTQIVPTDIIIIQDDQGEIWYAYLSNLTQEEETLTSIITDSSLTGSGIPESPLSAQSALNLKVDKVTGKGLSTEDYTTAEKNKLSGIASGATAYTNELADARVAAGITGKVDKVTGKGLSTEDYTTAEKIKLSGITEYTDAMADARVTVGTAAYAGTLNGTAGGMSANGSTTYGGLLCSAAKGSYVGIVLSGAPKTTFMDDGTNRGIYCERDSKWMFVSSNTTNMASDYNFSAPTVANAVWNDIAECMPSDGSLDFGDLAQIDITYPQYRLTKYDGKNPDLYIGLISQNPGFIVGENPDYEHSVYLALKGMIYTDKLGIFPVGELLFITPDGIKGKHDAKQYNYLDIQYIGKVIESHEDKIRVFV